MTENGLRISLSSSPQGLKYHRIDLWEELHISLSTAWIHAFVYTYSDLHPWLVHINRSWALIPPLCCSCGIHNLFSSNFLQKRFPSLGLGISQCLLTELTNSVFMNINECNMNSKEIVHNILTCVLIICRLHLITAMSVFNTTYLITLHPYQANRTKL